MSTFEEELIEAARKGLKEIEEAKERAKREAEELEKSTDAYGLSLGNLYLGLMVGSEELHRSIPGYKRMLIKVRKHSWNDLVVNTEDILFGPFTGAGRVYVTGCRVFGTADVGDRSTLGVSDYTSSNFPIVVSSSDTVLFPRGGLSIYVSSLGRVR